MSPARRSYPKRRRLALIRYLGRDGAYIGFFRYDSPPRQYRSRNDLRHDERDNPKPCEVLGGRVQEKNFSLRYIA